MSFTVQLRARDAPCLFLESFPVGGISPNSLQDKGNASPKTFYEPLSRTPVRSAQLTAHLRSVSKLIETILIRIQNVLNLS